MIVERDGAVHAAAGTMRIDRWADLPIFAMNLDAETTRVPAAHPPTAQPVERLRCRACKYEFTGVENVSTCPECGKPGTGAPLTTALLPSTDKPVCIRCGYDLAGLPAEARCSECGTLVGRSLHGNLLRYAAPEYLRTLNRGGLMVYLGIIGLCCTVFAAYPAFIFPEVLEGSIGAALGYRDGTMLAAAMLGAFSLAMVALIFAGWALLAAPDPAFVGRDPAARSRRTMRVSALVALAIGLALLALSLVPPTVMLTPSRLLILRATLGASLVPVSTVLFIASANYLKFLAKRIPDAALVKRLGVLHIVFYIAIASLIITVAYGALSPFAGGEMALPVVATIVLFAYVVVRYAGAIETLRGVFKEYAATAKYTASD